MSEPQQPPVPPAAQPNPASPPAPPAAHLPAAPQYPTAPQYSAAPQYPVAPPHAAAPQHPVAPAYPTSPQAYPTAAPGSQAHPIAPGFPGQVAPPARTSGSNPLGRTAFVIAVVTLAINLFSSLARPFVYSGGDGFEIMLAIDNGIGILSFFAYVVALVLGMIAVRRAAPQLLTGVAIGIAGAGAIGLAFSGLTIGLYQYL